MQKHDNLAAALDFIEKVGEAYLFPIIGYGSDGPIIPVKWGKDNSTRPDTIRQYAEDYPGCAFGIHLGNSGMVVVDVDDKGGTRKDGSVRRDGTKVMEELRAEGFEFPEDTLRVSTPSGNGYHLYYRGQCNNNHEGAIGESIDIKGGVGYVPAPGQHVRGKGQYSIEGSYRHPRTIPAWIPERVGEYDKEHAAERKARRAAKEAEHKVEPDQPHNIIDAIEYLTKQAETAYEGCRDTVSYKVACALHDRAISMEKAEELMYRFWVPRCQMGDWSLENVQAKIESAYERAAGAFGNADLSVHFKDVTQDHGFKDTTKAAPDDSEKRVRVPYLEKLEAATRFAHTIEPAAIPPRRWLVHGRFLESFVTVTISPGGIGKSTLSILEGLAVCCNRGKDWLNRKTYGHHAVWIYNLEDPQEELDRRVAAVAQHYKIELSTLDHFITTSGLTLGLIIARDSKHGIEINTRALQACKDFIIKHDVKLWIIDPLVKAHLVNENDNGSMDRLMTELSRIAKDTGCSIHLVHHTRKKNNDTGNGDADTARGASSVVNAARVAHTLNGMGSKEAALYGLGEEKGWYLRIDDAKANLTPPAGKAEWFKRVSVKLPNGDFVGVLEYTNIQKLVDNVPFNQLLIEQVMSIAPNGMIPTKNIASQLELTGEITKDDGQPMGAEGIKKAIERVFTNIVEYKGRTAQIGKGKRLRTGFPKSTVSWLDCEYSKELLEAQAVGDAKALGSGKG